MCYKGLINKCSFNFTFLKYKSKIIINNIDIKNQYTDKFSFPINIKCKNINFDNYFTINQLKNILNHGCLKTEYLINYNNINSNIIEIINIFSFNTFTSKNYTNNFKNVYLGNSFNGDDNQYINLNKIMYTNQENNLVGLNNIFFKKFYSNYFLNKTIKNEVNSILIDKFIKYNECLHLINIKYQDACLQSVNLFYKNEQYLFIVNTL